MKITVTNTTRGLRIEIVPAPKEPPTEIVLSVAQINALHALLVQAASNGKFSLTVEV